MPTGIIKLRVVAVLSVIVYCAASGFAAENVGWRGDGTGRFAAADPPQTWSPENHVVWKAELPGRSLASPIVVGDRVFVTANPTELLCFSAADGRLLWQRSHGYTDVFDDEKGQSIERDHERAREIQKQIGELHRARRDAEQAGQTDKKDELQKQISALDEKVRELRTFPPAADGEPGNTGGTPTSDGRSVFALFGNGIVSSHTVDGRQNWMVFVEAGSGDQSASPLLVDGKLIVQLRGLFALDAETGETLWRTDTPSRHGSPVAAKLGETKVIVTPAGAIVRLDDGEILARDQFRLGHSSPLVQDDLIYAMEDDAPKALKLTLEEEKNDKFRLPVVWEVESSKTKRLASPIYHEGLLYSTTEQGIFEVTDAKTGERVYRKRLNFDGGRADPSLCLAGGLIYISSNRGATIIIRPGRKYDEVARNSLDEFKSSLCFAGSRMYVRTKGHLWCIGQ